MKKYIAMIVCLALILGLTGCGSGSPAGQQKKQPAAVNDTAAEKDSGPASKSTESIDASKEDVDVDLTVLSSTMVYAEVTNMVTEPEKYVGKTVRIKGSFKYDHDESTGEYYFYCLVLDATACCAQGIEFVLTDEYVFPDDYPEVDSEICVEGTLDLYLEGDYYYCTLKDAHLQ